jgi:hypothetical protein
MQNKNNRNSYVVPHSLCTLAEALIGCLPPDSAGMRAWGEEGDVIPPRIVALILLVQLALRTLTPYGSNVVKVPDIICDDEFRK